LGWASWVCSSAGAGTSHEGTYRYILRDKAKGGSLHTHLRHKFRSYRRRSSPRVRRGRSPNQPMIGTRLRVVAERTRFGDYEIDTVIGRPVAGCYNNSSKLGSVEESATRSFRRISLDERRSGCFQQ
jgi:IS30 family transposase